VDGGVPGGHVAHRGEFLLGGGEARLDRRDLAEPALFLGLLEAVDQVGADLLQPGHLLGVGPQDGAADACFSELTDCFRDGFDLLKVVGPSP
jgi:hypothetical protein